MSRQWNRVLVVTLFLVMIALASAQYAVKAEEPQYVQPIVFKYSLNISVQYVYALTPSRAVLIGASASSNSIVEVVEFDDPLAGPKVIQSFPLVGKVTASAVDGYPPTRIAVGTDKGEITVFSVSQGRLYKSLHYLEGADFQVVKLVLMRSGTAVKVAALVSENGEQSGTCSDCLIYVFSDDSQSVLKIGAEPGNTTTAYEGIVPQDIGAVTLTTDTGVRNIPVLVLGWLPKLDMYTIVLNITYLENDETKPASQALVHVIAYRGERANLTVYTYGVNANSYGIASIPVPADFKVNITIYDIWGNQYKIYFDPALYGVNLKEFDMKITLNAPPQTGNAQDIYGAPEFMKENIEFISIDNAPSNYLTLQTLDKRIPTTFKGLTVVTIDQTEYVLLYVDTEKKHLVIEFLDQNFREIKTFTEYVGTVSEITSAYLTPSGDKLLVGLGDGRIIEYSIDLNNHDIHRLSEYVMSGNLRKLALKVSTPNFFIAVSEGGVQVVRLGFPNIPILRGGITPDFSPKGYTDGDAYPDLSLLVLGGDQSLYVVRGLEKAGNTPLDIEDYIAPSLSVLIGVPKGENPENATVTLSYPWGSVSTKTNEAGIATFSNLVPGYSYTIYVTPAQDYLKSASATVRIENYQRYNATINIEYRLFTVTLNVADELTGEAPIGSYDVLVDGKVVLESASGSSQTISVVFGEHNITVAPSTDTGKRIYYQTHIITKIDRATTIDLTMKRRRYELTLILYDEITRNKLDQPMMFYSNATPTYTIYNGTFSEYVPAGPITIVLKPTTEDAVMYQPSAPIQLMIVDDTELDIVINRTRYTLNITIVDAVTNRTASGTFRLTIGRLDYGYILTNTVVEAPYGEYVLELVPSPTTAVKYQDVSMPITIEGNVNLTILVNRRAYTLTLGLRDPISETPIVPLQVFDNGTAVASVEPGEKQVKLQLVYGVHVIEVRPKLGYEYAYTVVTAVANVTNNDMMAVTLRRMTYNLSIVLTDRYTGKLAEGTFTIYANNTIVAKEVSANASVQLPYGRYEIRVVPGGRTADEYKEPDPITVVLKNNTSISFDLVRNLYMLTVNVYDDIGRPMSGVTVEIMSETKAATVATLLTEVDGSVSAKLPYDTYTIVVNVPGFKTATEIVELSGERDIVITLQPETLTLVFRYLPIVVVIVLAAVGVTIALKIRARIASRVATAEEIF